MLASFIEQLRLLLENIILGFGYVGITVVMFVENIFPPIPSEVIIPFSGFLVGTGELRFLPSLLATTLGSLLGAIALYYLGVLLGEKRLRSLFKNYGKWVLLSEKDFDDSLAFFNRHSGAVVFWARFLPGIRSLISVPAGVAKMELPKFLLLTSLGTVLWNTLLLTAGIYLGQNWERILVFVDTYESIFYTLFVALVLFFVLRRLKKTRR
jgi:membrane protein DedA with SNARE-associated domain